MIWKRFGAWAAAAAVLTLGHVAAFGDPSNLERHTAIEDPLRHRMILFGGYDGAQATRDCWQLSLDAAPTWSALATQGNPPPRRIGQSAIYDAASDRMIVFGGLDSVFSSVLNDVWSLSFSTDPPTWNEITPAGTPPPARRYHSAIYDPVGGRMLAFGGSNVAGVPFQDVWSLSLTGTPAWEKLLPTGTPPPARFSHSAIYDPVRGRMLIYGGGLPAFKDVWALSLDEAPAWTQLQPSDDPRLKRLGHTAIYDPNGDRMVVFGGNDGNQPFDDVWSLSLAGTPSWSQVVAVGVPPSARAFHSAIRDAAYRRMIVFGGFPSVSEPTWGLRLDAPERWSPFRPRIAVSPPSLHLATVTVGDTLLVPFTVENTGLTPLTVSEFDPPSHAGLIGPPPATLAWNGSMTQTLVLAPDKSGVLSDSVVIVTDDPVTPRYDLNLDTNVLGLDFDVRVLDEPDQVPLGESFIVVVTPKPGVHVERGMLHYAVDTPTSPFFDLPLSPLATDLIATVPAEAVTEQGVRYYVTVENSGFTASQPVNAPAEFRVQHVAPPTEITAVPQATSGAEFLEGRAIEVEAVLPAGAIFESGVIEYRRGGTDRPESAPMTTGGFTGFGRALGTIPESFVGATGVEYRIVVQTHSATLKFPQPGAIGPDPFAVIRVKVPNLAESESHPGGRYRLFTVPLDFGEGFSGGVDALLNDQFGTYDPTRWRVYAFDAADQANAEFSPAIADQFAPSPGRGFWLITRADHQVDTKPASGTSTRTDIDYRIQLKAGWNLIGNPFAFPVAWKDAVHDPAIVGDPVAFDSRLGTIGDYATETPTVLEPFAGYFVHATKDTILLIPPVPGGKEPGVVDHPVAAADGWRFRLRATTPDAVDGSNEFGVASGTPREIDALKPPPSPGSWVQAAFVRSDPSSAGAYRRDLRAPGAEGERWEVEVRSAVAGVPVTIDLAAIVAPSADVVVRVLDREQGVVAEAGQPYRLVSFGSEPYHLTIVAGSERYVTGSTHDVLSAPTREVLDPNAPNPFSAATRIRFGLPRAERVSLEIFSPLGQRVAAPLDGEQRDPGFHLVVWDGRTTAGGQAPSGVYLMRLTAGATTLTRRVVRIQ